MFQSSFVYSPNGYFKINLSQAEYQQRYIFTLSDYLHNGYCFYYY